MTYCVKGRRGLPNLYETRTYTIPLLGLKGDFPLKYNFQARAGTIVGFNEKGQGLDVFIIHSSYQDTIWYKFLIAKEGQPIPPDVQDAYFYLGSIARSNSYLHIFGVNGDGSIYP